MTMGLVNRNITAKAAAASRANGQKSEGPVTAAGKLVSRRNALKHWGRAETIRDLFPALGEDPEEFKKVREDLYLALAPGDGFEALLVDDMAEIHWRLRRLIRAEAAAQATRRREQQAEREEQDAKNDAGRLHDLEPYTIPELGFAGLHDSPPKFARILQILGALRMFVEGAGFAQEHTDYLRAVYGSHNPGLRAKQLMGKYQRCLEEQNSAGEETRQANRAAFLRELDAEIAWFEERAARDRQARAELQVPRTEAELLKADYNQTAFMNYQEMLERRFERKWKLLMRHRKARQAAEEREARLAEERRGGAGPAGGEDLPHGGEGQPSTSADASATEAN
jgi:hypothetical protein